MIAELQEENRRLKEGSGSIPVGSDPSKASWLSASHDFGSRPMTSSSGNARTKELEEELKLERMQKKQLHAEVQRLKAEVSKGALISSTQGKSETFGSIPGVMEVDYHEVQVGEQIGQGGFSVICKGKWRGTPAAVKKIFDPVITEELLAEVQNEVRMLSLFRHPNIVLLMAICSKPPDLALVFEHAARGSLYDVLHVENQPMSVGVRLRIARDVACAMAFLHSSGVVHRDLKSYNILLDEQLHVKLCDFGLARFKADLGIGAMQYSGTPAYMSAELFLKKPYDEKVDVFAFGTLLWEIVTREVPYDGLDPSDIKDRVVGEQPLKMPFGTSKTIVQLVEDCRRLDSSKRPDFEYILAALDGISA